MITGLKDKVVLVTGSTAGIGREIALKLAQEDAIVIINGRSQKRIEETISELSKVIPTAKV